MWPPPPITPTPGIPKVSALKPVKVEPKEINYFNKTLKDSSLYTVGLGTILGLGVLSPTPAFTSIVTTFGLSWIVGKY